MRYSKILIATLPVFLSGCLDIFDDEPETYYTQPVPVVVPPAPKSPASPGAIPGMPSGPTAPPSAHGKTSCGCPNPQPQVVPAPVPAPIPSSSLMPMPEKSVDASDQPAEAEWFPTDGQLVRAGDLVMEMQRAGGVRPTHEAMAAGIRTKMGVTAPQAEKILEELGL